MEIFKKSGKLSNIQKMASSPDLSVREMANELIAIVGNSKSPYTYVVLLTRHNNREF